MCVSKFLIIKFFLSDKQSLRTTCGEVRHQSRSCLQPSFEEIKVFYRLGNCNDGVKSLYSYGISSYGEKTKFLTSKKKLV